MKIRTALVSTALLTSLFLADAALASPGYVSRNVNLRAGPDPSYPIVDRMRAGTRVEIYGCLDGWNWCEVGSRHDRGWVSGSYLQAVQRNRRVFIGQAGPVIRVPVISFEVGSYWDDHYRSKPFYHDRNKWAHDRDDRNDRHDNGRDDDRHDGPGDRGGWDGARDGRNHRR